MVKVISPEGDTADVADHAAARALVALGWELDPAEAEAAEKAKAKTKTGKGR